MDAQKKREEFAVSIRRKQTNSRIEVLRSMLLSSTEEKIDNHADLLLKIAQGQEPAQTHLRELKILSWEATTAHQMFELGIHRLLNASLARKQAMSDSEFKDIVTVLINLCVHVDLDMSSESMQVVASNISNHQREMVCLWLIANIIYQKSQFSMMVGSELVNNCAVLDYMQRRIGERFDNQGDIVIFNFFVCSFLVVSSIIDYAGVKRIFAIIEQIQDFPQHKEENFLFFSEALIDHAPHMAASSYLAFDSPLMAHFAELCKTKKTKFVRNYLKMLVMFVTYDPKAYEKMLSEKIFLNLDFCLENRFPQIKGLCADVGCILLDNHGLKVDIDNIGFFAELSTAFVKFEKYPIVVQVKLLKFSYRFFRIAGDSKGSQQEKNKFIDEAINSNMVDALASITVTSNGHFELLVLSLGILEILMNLDAQDRVAQKCEAERLPEFVAGLETANEQLASRLQSFLSYFQMSDMIS